MRTFGATILSTLLTLLISSGGARAQEFVWAKQLGGISTNETTSSADIVLDGNANAHTVGYFQGTADFDPGPGIHNMTTSGSSAAFISKLDSAGNFVWAKQLATQSGSVAYGVTLDSSGNVHTVGYFFGTADFDPGPGTFYLTSAGWDDVFISKLDSSGNFVWARRLGGSSKDHAYSVALDSSGNVFTVGYFRGTVDFDPGPGTYNLSSEGLDDVFISKLDSTGSFVWARKLSGPSRESASDVALDNNGNVYTVGSFGGSVDFDPGPGTYFLTEEGEYADVFVSKLDSAGNFVWARRLGGTESTWCCNDMGWGVGLDENDNVYTVGEFEGTADFDPGPGTYSLTSVSGGDAFICKLDSTGAFVWAAQVGGQGWDSATGVVLDGTGHVYTVGLFADTADFDPGPGTFYLTSAGQTDAFISEFDSLGKFVWARQVGGPLQDGAGDVALDNNGYVHTVGNFQGTADFDPGSDTFYLTAGGWKDAFISKLASCGQPGIACDDCADKGDATCDGTVCDVFDIVAAIDEVLEGSRTNEADVDCNCTLDVFDIVCLIDCALDRSVHCLVDPCVGGSLQSACQETNP